MPVTTSVPRCLQFLFCRSLALHETAATHRDLLFHFLVRLPRVQISDSVVPMTATSNERNCASKRIVGMSVPLITSSKSGFAIISWRLRTPADSTRASGTRFE